MFLLGGNRRSWAFGLAVHSFRQGPVFRRRCNYGCAQPRSRYAFVAPPTRFATARRCDNVAHAFATFCVSCR